MAAFKEVSLGFAEFVSQLIQETFDAILSSQNYQLEKFAELQTKLNLPTKAFKDNFISNDEIEAKIIERFGSKIEKKMTVTEEIMLFLNDTFESEENLVYNKKLTSLGYDSIYNYVVNTLVEERKEILNTLINNSNISNIVVDSGEINAKLELTNLFEQDSSTETEKPVDPPKKLEFKKIDTTTKSTREVALPSSHRKIDVIDYKDPKSGKRTVLIDKKTISDISQSNFQIPKVRLAVQPTKITEVSNLYSEIKINFKTK